MIRVSGIYTSPFLDTDELKMALRARNVFRAFEKRAPGLDWARGPLVLRLAVPPKKGKMFRTHDVHSRMRFLIVPFTVT